MTVSQIDILQDFFGDGHSLSVLRLDLPDPLSGGNKSYKLKYNLEEMQRLGLNTLITFGGAFSNHVAAVATAGKNFGFETIGIIRGDELNADSNAVLKHATSCGMKTVFISREDYRKRNDPDFINELLQKHGPAYVLPEGGSNVFAVKGCKEILSEETDLFDTIICPVGTGATLAGFIASAKAHQHIIGIAVLEGKEYLENEVTRLLQDQKVKAKWKIEHGFTFGGYGKTSKYYNNGADLEIVSAVRSQLGPAGLENFKSEMKLKYDLPLDLIYSAKALFATRELNKSYLTKTLFIHTGGYAFSG